MHCKTENPTTLTRASINTKTNVESRIDNSVALQVNEMFFIVHK